MATVNVVNGTVIGIWVDGTLIAKATSGTLNANMSARDITNKDSAGWKGNLHGLRDWSMDVEALHAEDNAYGLKEIMALVIARTQVNVRFSSEVSGDEFYSGDAVITSVSANAPVEDNVSYSVSLEGNGALAQAVQT